MRNNLPPLSGKEFDVFSRKDLNEILNIIFIVSKNLSIPTTQSKFVKAIQEAFQADSVVFRLGDIGHKAIDNTELVSIGIDRKSIEAYYRQFFLDDPFRLALNPRTVVMKIGDVLTYEQWQSHRIYKEFYQPQNIHYKLSIYIRYKSNMVGVILIYRSKESGDFSEVNVSKARTIAYFLQSFLGDETRFAQVKHSSDTSIPVTNPYTRLGLIILDSDFNPLYWNQEAKDFCDTIPNKQVERQRETGKLYIPYEIIQDCLDITSALKSANPTDSIRRQRILDAGTGKHFLTIAVPIYNTPKAAYSAYFSIYSVDISDDKPLTIETLMEKHHLTRKEAEIIQYVFQGLTNKEIAMRLGVSWFTVATHLKNIFHKTGVSHRSGIANLLKLM